MRVSQDTARDADAGADRGARVPSSRDGYLYNPFENPFRDDPYPHYARARREAPVFYSEPFRLWVVTGYEEVFAAVRDPKRFSSARMFEPIAPLPPEVAAVLGHRNPLATDALLNTDPPIHTRLRGLFTASFTPQRIARLEGQIRAGCRQLVDAIAASPAPELVGQLAFPLPLSVIAALIGIPAADLPRVKAMHDAAVMLLVPGLPLEAMLAHARTTVEYWEYYEALLHDRRRDPRDDLATAMVQAELAGEPPLSAAEMVAILVVLLSAGHETTSGLIGSTLLILLRERRDLWDALPGRPELLGPIIEESLRLESPVPAEARFTTEPVRLGGVDIPAGERLHLCYGAANRDERVFPDPDVFDLRRPNVARHLAFGWGIHYCIGAPLSRLEGRVAISVLRERLPGLRIEEGYRPEFAGHYFLRAPARLPVVLG